MQKISTFTTYIYDMTEQFRKLKVLVINLVYFFLVFTNKVSRFEEMKS